MCVPHIGNSANYILFHGAKMETVVQNYGMIRDSSLMLAG